MSRYCLNLVQSWNMLFSPSMVIESFAGLSNPCWHPRSLNVCIMLDQDLLVFIVFIEKSGVILIGLPLYVSWPFLLQLLILFPYSVCLVF